MKRTDYIKSFILVVITLFLTLQKGAGYVVFTLLPFFLVYLIYNLYRMIRRHEERRRRGISVVIWLFVYILACSIQTYWNASSRRDADMVSQKVLTYRNQTGKYPTSLREVGLDELQLREKWNLSYSEKAGKPQLNYPAQMMPLTMYEYDFVNKRWISNAY